MKELRSLYKYVLKYKYQLIFGVICIFFTNYFLIYIPNDVKKTTDIVIDFVKSNKENHIITPYSFWENPLSKTLLYQVALIFFHALLQGAFLFVTRQMIIVNSRKIEYDLKNTMYQHYQILDANFYKQNNTGDLMSRITEDLGRVRELLGPALMYFINTSMLLPMVIYNMIQANHTLTYCVLIPFPILVISIYYVNKLVDQKSEKIQEKLSDLTSFAQETYSGIRVVKSYVREDNIAMYFEKECVDYKSRSLALTKIDSLWFPIIILLIGISNVLVLLVGGKLVINGEVKFGTLLEFMMYVNIITFPVSNLGWVTGMIQRGITSMRRINVFLQTPTSIVSGPESVDLATQDIVWKNVNFTYTETGIQALKNISFHIPAGQKWAIIGKTGSGKSTIAELLFRMYDVDSGEIQIGSTNLKKIDLETYRNQIGYAPQEVFLFSDTIAHNVSFGTESSSQKTIEAACKMSCIDTEIKKLAQGYDTTVGERGVTLSGGQKQRISIARAFVNQPKLIVLDDCLSAVDAQTEHQILTNMEQVLSGKTSIIITHRVFALQDFDQILVMHQGSIVEQSTHEQLLQQQGYYTQMYQEQMEQHA
ncbi:MAG: ABC transporter ATP-binding protein [Bacteroidota bacterium]